MWLIGPTRVWIHEGLGEWSFFLIENGTFQGECASTAVFCLAMREIIDIIQAAHPHALLLAYNDDVLLVTPPEMLPSLWSDWGLALDNFGMSLNVSKCEVWIPSAT